MADCTDCIFSELCSANEQQLMLNIKCGNYIDIDFEEGIDDDLVGRTDVWLEMSYYKYKDTEFNYVEDDDLVEEIEEE